MGRAFRRAKPQIWPVAPCVPRVALATSRPPSLRTRTRGVPKERALRRRRRNMSRIELTGLIGSHPLGALASLGLLRVVSQTDGRARLSFVERDDWIGVLESDFGTVEDLLAFLVEW